MGAQGESPSGSLDAGGGSGPAREPRAVGASEGDPSRSERDFLTMVSHELRHAAGVVSGLLDLVLVHADELGEERAQQLLVRARDNARRLNRLLEDSDAALRLGSGRFSFDLQPLDLGAVVATTVAQVVQVAARDIDVLQLRPLPPVAADHDRQVQILTNLLSNAIAYSPEGSPIRVDVAPEQDAVAVRVRNAGTTVTSEQIARLFEPFVRLDADDPHRPKGAGLGLYITRMLVEGQGGTIRAESHDEGWSVTYTVPRADGREAPPPTDPGS